MMFRAASADGRRPALAISQPAHAWVSGQLLRAWAEPLDEALLLAAELHDIGWLDWEAAPTFDPRTGRPQSFRAVGAAVHAPMWALGVERALAAWGSRIALLISLHGSMLYSRYVDRQRAAPEDVAAADDYLAVQGERQAGWTRALSLDPAVLRRDMAMVALADSLSLALCGDLAAPLDLERPDGGTLHLMPRPDANFTYTVDPWPFRGTALTVEAPARALPATPFADAAAMRAWLASAAPTSARAVLTP